MAKTIVLTNQLNGPFSFTVDGEQFPWWVSNIRTGVANDSWPSITITIEAEEVTVSNAVSNIENIDHSAHPHTRDGNCVET